MSEVKVSPRQPWPEPGIADVVRLDTQTRVVLPVEQRQPGAYTVRKSDYPNGVVFVNPAFRTTPPDNPVQWTLVVTDQLEETCGPGWADGVVVLFQD